MNKAFTRLVACTTLLLAGAAQAQSQAQSADPSTLYSQTGNLTFSSDLLNSFNAGQVTVTPVTQTTSPVTTVGGTTPVVLSGLTFNPTTGVLYGTVQTGGSINLSQITGQTIPSTLLGTTSSLQLTTTQLDQLVPNLNGIVISPAAVPEHGTWALMCLGLAGLGWARSRSQRN